MLFHWFADKIIILQTKEGRKITEASRNKLHTLVIKWNRTGHQWDISRCFLSRRACFWSYLFGEIVLPLHKNPIRWPPPPLARVLCWLISTFPVFDTQNAVGHTHNNGLIVRLVRIMTNSHSVLAPRMSTLCSITTIHYDVLATLKSPKLNFMNSSVIVFAVLLYLKKDRTKKQLTAKPRLRIEAA